MFASRHHILCFSWPDVSYHIFHQDEKCERQMFQDIIHKPVKNSLSDPFLKK